MITAPDAMMVDVNSDAIILGAGILGCSTAYYLARDGLSVTVLDPVGIAAGASGRNNGIIEHPYDPATERLFYENVEILTEELGAAFNPDPLQVLLLADDEDAATALEQHYSRFERLRAQVLAPAEARAAEPLLTGQVWACALDTGHPVRPLEATTAFADLARRAGAQFVLGDRVEVLRDGEQLIGATSGGVRYLADALVVSAGAASTALLDGLVRPDLVTPLWGVIVAVELPRHPQHPLIEGALALAHGNGEVAIEAPFTLLDSPSWLAVGSTMLKGSRPDPDAWGSRLLEHGVSFVPSIAQARVKDVMVCARPLSFDNHPLLGRIPGQTRAWLATGHGGRGMSLGPASGRLLARAIRARDDAIIPAALSTRRLA